MNCTDISEILASEAPSRLPELRRTGAADHLRSCPECARDWQLSEQLASALIPAMPSTLALKCQRLSATHEAIRGSTLRARLARLGLLLAVASAAAAGLYGLRMLIADTPGTESAAHSWQLTPEAAFPVSTTAPDVGTLPAPPTSPEVPASSYLATSKKDSRADLFVTMLPLRHATTDAEAQAASNDYYGQLLEVMRKVPGLVLVTGHDIPSTGIVDGEGFQIYLTTLPPYRPDSDSPYRILRTQLVMSRGGTPVLRESVASAVADSADPMACLHIPVCQRGDMRFDAAFQAQRTVRMLMQFALPPAESEALALRARVLDDSLPMDARIKALSQFLRGRPQARKHRLDGQIAAVAVDFGHKAIYPQDRRLIWRLLRGSAPPSLSRALLQAVTSDRDRDVRIEALLTLNQDFGRDVDVEQSLAQLAMQESDSVIRELATQNRNPDAWRRFVQQTLRDATLPDAMRLEPLRLTVEQPRLSLAWLEASGESGESAALLQILRRIGAQRLLQEQPWSFNILRELESPAATALLLEGLDAPDSAVRLASLAALSGTKRHEPTVKAALEQVLLRDIDREVRDQAVTLLL